MPSSRSPAVRPTRWASSVAENGLRTMSAAPRSNAARMSDSAARAETTSTSMWASTPLGRRLRRRVEAVDAADVDVEHQDLRQRVGGRGVVSRSRASRPSVSRSQVVAALGQHRRRPSRRGSGRDRRSGRRRPASSSLRQIVDTTAGPPRLDGTARRLRRRRPASSSADLPSLGNSATPIADPVAVGGEARRQCRHAGDADASGCSLECDDEATVVSLADDVAASELAGEHLARSARGGRRRCRRRPRWSRARSGCRCAARRRATGRSAPGLAGQLSRPPASARAGPASAAA